jgi:hypothetical protein
VLVQKSVYIQDTCTWLISFRVNLKETSRSRGARHSGAFLALPSGHRDIFEKCFYPFIFFHVHFIRGSACICVLLLF